MSGADVAVVGLGPAGRALAHRLHEAGARVVAYDPAPDAPWRCTYGGWLEQVPGWLPASVIGARADDVALIAHRTHRLGRAYGVLDNAALRDALPLTGVTVRAERVGEAELRGLAPVVVDCRGSWPTRAPASVPVQSAWGVRLPPAAAEPLLGGAEAVLMDWRAPTPSGRRGRAWGRTPPSFCYVIPLPDGGVLAEETCLAGAPALPLTELRTRLELRLRHAGLPADACSRAFAAKPERVWIPLVSAPRAGGVVTFGAAGTQLNPISGYSVFASLAQADAWARTLTDGTELPRHDAEHALRLRALGALLRLPPDSVVALFDSFGRLEPARQRAVLVPVS